MRKSTLKTIARGAVAGIATLSMVCSLAACGGSSGSGSDGSEITMYNGTGTTINENWNPFSATGLAPVKNGLIYENLFWNNSAKKQDLKPLLGTEYSWNDDGSVLTVKTRENVKWSDGKAFSANDVAYTFNLVRSTPALNLQGLTPNAKAVDDNTVEFTFDKPNSYTQEAAVLTGQPIVPEHIWKDIKDPTSTINQNPVGTGTYMLDKFNNQSYTVKVNENYWGGAPKVKRVRFLSLSDADGASNALISGQLDYMTSFIPGIDSLLKNNKQLSYVNVPTLTTVIMTCSNADYGCTGPQTDPAVRQAMYYAMNRTQLNKLAGSGLAKTGSPTLLLADRDQDWITDKDLVETPAADDAAKAEQILEDAGWTKGSDGIREKDGQKLSMTIMTVSGWSDYLSINDILKQEFKKVGIELKTTQMAWNDWNDKERKGDYQLSLDSVGNSSSTDPYYLYNSILASTNATKKDDESTGSNMAKYVNPTVDAAIEAAGDTQDEATKKEQYAIIQEQLMNDMPYVPIYLNSSLSEFNTSKVTGWPSEDNLYCNPANDLAEMLKVLEPVK